MYKFICKFALLAAIPVLILTFTVDLSLSNGGSYLAKQVNQPEKEVREFINQFMQAFKIVDLTRLMQMTVGEVYEALSSRLESLSWDEIQSLRERNQHLEWEIIEVQVEKMNKS